MIFHQIILASILLSTTWGTMVRAETIIVGGTGSGLGVMRILGEAFHHSSPEHDVKVLPSLGSSGGISALEDKAVDVAIISRDLKEDELDVGFVYKLGKSALVFAVNPGVQESSITLSQVVGIYSGDMTTWQDGNLIRRILRPPNESDRQVLQHLSQEMAEAIEKADNTPGLLVAMTDSDVMVCLEKNKGSFGPTTLAMILSEKRNVKILNLDGVHPSADTLKNGRYLLTKPYFLLIRADTPESVQGFIRFIQSPEGIQIVLQNGIFPDSTIMRK